MLRGDKTCGTPLEYEHWILESLVPVAGDACGLVKRLTQPSSRLYVRVNTLRVGVEDYLEVLETRGLRFERDEEIPEAIWAPVTGPHRFRVYPKRVVADKRAAESVLMGSDLYAPGVLDARGVEPGDKVTITAPNGVPVGSGTAVESWKRLKPLVDEARRHRRSARLGVFVKVDEPMYRAPRTGDLPGIGEGLVYGQSLPSMYVARLLDPQPGESIIDLTAAPGGKVSHVAALAGPESRIVAVDRPGKARRLAETLRRLGATWVRVVSADSRYLVEDHPSLEGKFDKVIVDPPCTNLGVIPKVMDSRGRRDVRNLADYQFQILRTAARLARKGGLVSYSVCTLTAPETTGQSARVVDELGLEPVEPPRWARRPIRTGWGVLFSPTLHGVTGFYIALFRRI